MEEVLVREFDLARPMRGNRIDSCLEQVAFHVLEQGRVPHLGHDSLIDTAGLAAVEKFRFGFFPIYVQVKIGNRSTLR